MTEQVTLSVVGGVVAITTALSGGVVTIYLAKIQKQGTVAAIAVKEVAVKTEEVKATLESVTKATDQKLTSIHTLVNSNMGAQLKISAVALRRISMITKHPDDDAAALTAERLLQEHEGKQLIVDTANAEAV